MEEQNFVEWLRYAKANRRDERMAEVWVAPLIDWLLSDCAGRDKLKVLDYGCGYMDASLGLIAHVNAVYGYDIDTAATRIAARRMKELGVRGRIFERREDIPEQSFDLIIVNSVIQYLASEQVLQELLGFLGQRLNHSPLAKIVVSDILPPSYRSIQDALRSLWVALRTGCLWAMLRHLYFAATKPSKLALLKLDLATLGHLAQQSGLMMQVLPENLTPSRQRYSVVLKRVDQ